MKCYGCNHDERWHNDTTTRCEFGECRCPEFVQQPSDTIEPPGNPNFHKSVQYTFPWGAIIFATESLSEKFRLDYLNNPLGAKILQHFRKSLEDAWDIDAATDDRPRRSEVPGSFEAWLDSPAGKDWLTRYRRYGKR